VLLDALEHADGSVHGGADELLGVGGLEVERRGSVRDTDDILDRLVKRSGLFRETWSVTLGEY
jgi:hypothetical protein